MGCVGRGGDQGPSWASLLFLLSCRAYGVRSIPAPLFFFFSYVCPNERGVTL